MAKLAVETRFAKLAVETRFAKLAVETRLTKLAVETTDLHTIVERYPNVPNPVIVDVTSACTIFVAEFCIS